MIIEHRCVICEKMIQAADEDTFERLWEEHRITHPITGAEPKQDLPAPPVPADAELEEGGKIIPLDDQGGRGTDARYLNDKDHEQDLARHYEGVSRIEQKLPQMIDFAFKMGQMVGTWAKEKCIPTKLITTGDLFWTPDGEIAIEFGYDADDVVEKVAPVFLKSGYARLPTLQKHYPAVFDVCLTIGHHLCNMIDQKKVRPKEIEFKGLHHFVSRFGVNMFAFRIYRKGGGVLKAGDAKM